MKVSYIPESIPPNQESSAGCQHKWTHLGTKKYYESMAFNTKFTRVDSLYCEKCCEIKNKTIEDYCRAEPDWY